MKKLLCLICLFTLIGSASATTIRKGSRVFITGDKTITLLCSVTDTGVGIADGKAKFRLRYIADGVVTPWSVFYPYSDVLQISIEGVETCKEFYIEGVFQDSVGNETPIPLIAGYIPPTDPPGIEGDVFIYDDLPPVGEFSVKIDATLP